MTYYLVILTDIHLGKTAIFKNQASILIHGINLLLIRFKENVSADFLNYQFKYKRRVGEFVGIAQKSVNQSSINQSKLKNLDFILPPIQVQKHIVSKIEELFSELDKGIEELKTAQQQLKVYRQAVLKWAFEGRLTNEDVKEGELPKGWKYKKLSEVSKRITDGEHFRPITQETGIPFLSAKDVRDTGVSFDEPLFISEETARKALQRCDPEKGDILIVSRGATVGRLCIVKTNKFFCLLGSVILIKAKIDLSNEFLAYVLKSPEINRKLI